jgi:DNA-binding transcriptional MocR family regulator
MLSQALPDLTFQCQASSYHIWLTLPPSWQVDSLVQTAKEHGVLVSSGHFFEAQNQPNHSIRISLMAIADDAVFQSGLKQLVSLIKRENLSVMPI